MSYAYGMKGAPAVGNGLGGLPRRLEKTANGDDVKQVFKFAYQVTRIVEPGSGVIDPPAGAKLMRVTVVGGGGGCRARTSTGAGGGGCATHVTFVPAEPVEYTVGSAGRGSSDLNYDRYDDGQDSLASFSLYDLIGRGGKKAAASSTYLPEQPALGGMGEGGEVNYKGGDGYYGGGGGAGPNGNGGNGGEGTADGNDGGYDDNGHGPGGGGGGAGNNSQGGGGTGAKGGTIATSSYNYEGGDAQGNTEVAEISFEDVTLSSELKLAWGEEPYKNVSDNQGSSGGAMGGGGGGYRPSSSFDSGYGGGHGGLVIEWVFY